MKNKKFQIWLPTLFAMLFALGIFVGTELDNDMPFLDIQSAESRRGANGFGGGKVEEILNYVEARYVDDMDEEELMEEAIGSVIEDLDPHSNYIPAEQLALINEQLEGNFDGIGVEFMTLEDTIVIITPLVGGPSEKVGILAGDKIIAVEDTIVAGKDVATNDVIEKLRGKKGTAVNISILRGNEEKLRDFKIIRDEIPLHSVDVACMLDEKTGYIKITRFSAKTYEEFMQGLERLVEEYEMKNLVIDVRHNPGGYLQQATNILSQFFKDRGKLLVYTEGRTVKRTDYKTSGRFFFDIDDIAILIDESSASASEIVAGAIQDLDRGVVVGRRSFGKGLVQEQYDLHDGSALRLTVARYYTPSGRSIQRTYEDLEDYNLDIQRRYEAGELSEAKTVEDIDSLKFYTRRGRVVYGGGGITPDIFVPIDTTFLSAPYGQLSQQLSVFLYRFIEDNKAKLDQPLSKMRLPENAFPELLSYAMEQNSDISGAIDEETQSAIEHTMLARIAKHFHGDEGFYYIWNQEDEVVRTALNALYQDDPLKLQALKEQ
ncbi:MAG: S41 family peptidase [Bacteroidota bacterium]